MSEKEQQPEEQQPVKKLTLEERKALGKAGKLWNIEVICRAAVEPGRVATEIKRHHLFNQTERELFQFRQHIFTAGIMLPIDPGKWVIVPPDQLLQIFAHRQSNFFEP